MRVILLYGILLSLVVGCVQKSTPSCMQESGVSTCDQLFDAMQANMSNPAELMKLQECYKTNCQ